MYKLGRPAATRSARPSEGRKMLRGVLFLILGAVLVFLGAVKGYSLRFTHSSAALVALGVISALLGVYRLYSGIRTRRIF
ncbi:MAG TPA: hypothetical protein PKG80_04075 [Acidobacteriota bacterium]|nr:hypothetical protein [Acidobacteriota bacterium]